MRQLLLLVFLSIAMSSAVAQRIQVSVWSGYPEMEAFYNYVAADYMAENPNVEITVLTQPLREYERRLTLALPSGTAADIIEISFSFIGRFVQAGLIPPLPERASEFVRSGAYDDFFVEAASYDGQVYGIPLFRGQGALFYNTAMFEAAGLPGPPRTMDEYVEYANRLTQRDANGNPIVSGWSLRLGGGGSGIAEKFWTIMHQFGGSLVEQTPDGGWIAGYDNEAGREALLLYVNLLYRDRVLTPELKGDAEGFQLGTTAMFIRESWVIGDIAAKAPHLPYATAHLPVGTIVLPVNLYVTSSKPEAVDFALYAVQPKYQLWLFENVGWLPNRRDIDYSPIVERIPQAEAFLTIPDDHILFTVPPISPIDEIQTRLAERLVRAFADPNLAENPTAVDAFLAEAAAETNQILRREGLLGQR